MYCKHCGKALEPQDNFCQHCGQSASGNKSVHKSSMQKAPPNHTPFWFKALLCIIVVILGAFILTAFLSEDLIDTVEDQLKAIRNGQITEAYYDFTSQQFQNATSLEQFHEFIKQYPAFADNRHIHFNDRNAHDDGATLDAVMTTSGGQKSLVKYKLVKQSEKWKIFSIKIQDDGTP